MLYTLEIDNTISINSENFIRGINRIRSMGVKGEIIDYLNKYNNLLCSCRYHASDIILPLPGAAEGVKQLAENGKIAYVTSRPEREGKESRAWLASYGFPNAEETYHCNNIQEKYKVVHSLAGNDEQIIAIGYRLEQVIKTFEGLCRARPRIAYELMSRIELVGVGYNEHPKVETCLRTSILPSWQKEDFAIWKARGTRAEN